MQNNQLDVKALLRRTAAGDGLDEREAHQLVCRLMSNAAEPLSDAQIGAYLFSSAVRKIGAGELVGAVRALREHMVRVPVDSEAAVLLDTCGTGGSGIDTFNTSTAAAFVCAGCGVTVVKHGNRAATSSCGSADVLAELGFRLDLTPEQLAACARETGFCFMFAPSHHPATKRVAGIRRELGVRTIFNFIGPLSNPAGANHQVIGVSDREMAPVMAAALGSLGTARALVVRGRDGLDEISLGAETEVWELRHGSVTNYLVSPEELGLERVPSAQVGGLGPVESAKKIRAILEGETGAYTDLVLLNAGAALYACNQAEGIREGIAAARESITSGRALRALETSLQFSR